MPLELLPWQQLGLAFLLGSFTVATLSDMKYLSAQREFLEVWLAFLAVFFLIDLVSLMRGPPVWPGFVLRWGLLAGLCLVSWRGVGWLFRLAPGDVAALAAAACLLPVVYILIYFALARLFATLLRPLLAGDRRVWPFMPVVTLATLVLAVLGRLL